MNFPSVFVEPFDFGHDVARQQQPILGKHVAHFVTCQRDRMRSISFRASVVYASDALQIREGSLKAHDVRV